MCRILFYKGTVLDRLTTLLDLIKQASKNDPLLNIASNSKRKAHSDGWGYALLTKNTSIYYKSLAPIYNDVKGFTNLLDTIKSLENEEVVLLVHTRAASEGSINMVNTQPIKYSTSITEFFLAHNGTLYKERLLQILNIKHSNTENLSDTYLAGLYIAYTLESLDTNSLLKAYRILANYTKSAFNTISIFIPFQEDTIVIITNYYVTQEPAKTRYYQLFIEEKNNYTAYYSSTIYMLDEEKNAKPIHNNTIHVIKNNTHVYEGKLVA